MDNPEKTDKQSTKYNTISVRHHNA